ncbi:hypothetical protein KAX35_08200, partial [candidate division WOR-3 bacterium]|nr:hypothetical protein [candidate division WOR-3 bacterium]
TNDNRGNHSHINIYDVSSSDTVMRFSIKFNFKRSGFPIECASFFDVSSPTLLDDYIVVAAMDTLLGGGTTFGAKISLIDSMGAVEWISTIHQANLFASPAVGDIDGDGSDDIVTCPFYVYLYVIDKKVKIIYSMDLREEKDSVYLIKGDVWAFNGEGDRILYLSEVTDGEIICTPLLADVDSDGKDEIFFGCNDGFLYGYKYPGNPVSGFPVNLHQWIWATPVWDSLIGTLYAVSGDGRLFAIEISDSVYIKWTALESYVGQMSSSSPVVKYGDGIIVSRGDGWIYSVSDSGTINWKRNFGAYSFYTSPAIAEENTIIVVGGELHSLNINGAEAPGFPIKLDN